MSVNGFVKTKIFFTKKKKKKYRQHVVNRWMLAEIYRLVNYAIFSVRHLNLALHIFGNLYGLQSLSPTFEYINRLLIIGELPMVPLLLRDPHT